MHTRKRLRSTGADRTPQASVSSHALIHAMLLHTLYAWQGAAFLQDTALRSELGLHVPAQRGRWRRARRRP